MVLYFAFIVFSFSIYQVSISCFQEHIDSISKIFKISFDGLSVVFGSRLCNMLKI